MDKEELVALADQVEAATGPDREIDIAISTALACVPEGYERAVVWDKPQAYFWHAERPKEPYWSPCQYTASLDAAMTLVPEGWSWNAWSTGFARAIHPTSRIKDCEGRAMTPALALTAVCLRAIANT